MALSRRTADPFFTHFFSRDPFEDFFTSMPLSRGMRMPEEGERGTQQQQLTVPMQMHMDVRETDQGFSVAAELPGMNKDGAYDCLRVGA
jgi:HSP20 family molecular chaperone IbpA